MRKGLLVIAIVSFLLLSPVALAAPFGSQAGKGSNWLGDAWNGLTEQREVYIGKNGAEWLLRIFESTPLFSSVQTIRYYDSNLANGISSETFNILTGATVDVQKGTVSISILDAISNMLVIGGALGVGMRLASRISGLFRFGKISSRIAARFSRMGLVTKVKSLIGPFRRLKRKILSNIPPHVRFFFRNTGAVWTRLYRRLSRKMARAVSFGPINLPRRFLIGIPSMSVFPKKSSNPPKPKTSLAVGVAQKVGKAVVYSTSGSGGGSPPPSSSSTPSMAVSMATNVATAISSAPASTVSAVASSASKSSSSSTVASTAVSVAKSVASTVSSAVTSAAKAVSSAISSAVSLVSSLF